MLAAYVGVQASSGSFLGATRTTCPRPTSSVSNRRFTICSLQQKQPAAGKRVYNFLSQTGSSVAIASDAIHWGGAWRESPTPSSQAWHLPPKVKNPSLIAAVKERLAAISASRRHATEQRDAQVPGVRITLTDKERQLFDLLMAVVYEENMNTTLRVAGGWVRDKLLKTGVADSPAHHKVDIDIALDDCLGRDFADKVNSYLRRHGEPEHGVGVVGKNPEKSKHLETATMNLMGFWIDFVNLRTESYTQDSRIPNMGIGTPAEDAFRRDLTINALFYNINTGCVEDWTGRGAADLKARVVNTPLPAEHTLLDDPLRVLRSIRFASRLDFAVAPDLMEACSQPEVHQALAKKVSRERVGAEVDLMVRSRAPLRAFQLIAYLNLLPVVFSFPPDMMNVAPNLNSVFQHSLVYLRNMHFLLREGVKLGQLCRWDSHEDFVEERRLALYAAILLPFADTYYRDKTGTHPVTRYMMLQSLKLRTKDGDRLTLVHRAALDFQVVMRRSLRNGSITEDTLRHRRPLDRLELGLMLRRVGSLWRVALLLALTGDLGTQHILKDTAHRSFHAEADTAIIAAYVGLAERITQMGLDGVWDLKPLLDGRAVQELLTQLPKGKVFKEIMDGQIRWMISHPNGTRAELAAELAQQYAQFR